MTDRPYTLLSCAISIDGYLDGGSPERLILSNDADLDRVDAVRAGCDAILVGARTVRNDNPRLLVRSRTRVHDRVAAGRTPKPIKVTVTERARLPPSAAFFFVGETEKLVYCASDTVSAARALLGPAATVIDGGQPVVMRGVSASLYARGVRRLVVAPFFVGDSRARRFVDDGWFPWNPQRRATLVEVRKIGDVVLLRYALSSRCRPG